MNKNKGWIFEKTHKMVRKIAKPIKRTKERRQKLPVSEMKGDITRGNKHIQRIIREYYGLDQNLQKIEKKGTLSNSFYESSVTSYRFRQKDCKERNMKMYHLWTWLQKP